MNNDAVESCNEIIQVHSKSFALASRLLPRGARDRAVVVYAWCRRADDAVDLADGNAASAIAQLRHELDDVYAGRDIQDPIVAVFQNVVHECGIHRAYPEDLLVGLEMDVQNTRYEDKESLLRYCYCVAGTVGLMMCHVMGLSDERATRNAVHLGIAMQLTNICRDVFEDWERGRLYIPTPVLVEFGCGDLVSQLGGRFPETARTPVAKAIDHLLDEADRYYTSGDAGLPALSWRCALSIRTARKVYAAIGDRIRGVGCDPLAGRAIVPLRQKLVLTSSALLWSLAELPRRLGMRLSSVELVAPTRRVKFPEDVLPI